MKIELIALKLPEIKKGACLGKLIVKESEAQAAGLEDGDVILVTSKIVSKAQGRIVKLDSIKPEPKAKLLARSFGKDPRLMQLILEESKELLFAIPLHKFVKESLINLESFSYDVKAAKKLIENDKTLLVVEHKSGLICSDAGIDSSNHPKGFVSLLPQDPGKAAKDISLAIKELTGKDTACVITDTEISIGFGSLEKALGVYGISPFAKEFGKPDRFGKPKFGGVDNVADMLACAAGLVWGQTSAGIPVVIIRGLKYDKKKGVEELKLSTKNLRKMFWLSLMETLKLRLLKNLPSLPLF